MSTLIKQMGRLSVATVLIMMWGCGGASQEQEVSLETTDARLSYGIGLRMGQRMATDGMTVDVAAYAAGLEDALTGADAKLTDEEINTEMSAFQERREAEAGAERVALAQSNLEAGRAYMAEMSSAEGVQTTESGLQYIVMEAGEGDSPVAADSVEVHYEGQLIDGTVFDSSFERGETVTFGLTQVIPGWTEGLQLMKPGGKFKFIIPPELGYGEGGAGQMIGPNATLRFDVELIAVVKADAE
jgi:FKBP-type peptidyl-prolyl cis-trans isomerase